MKKKKPPFWMFNIFTNQLRVSTQHMNFNNILIISEEIKKKKLNGFMAILQQLPILLIYVH